MKPGLSQIEFSTQQWMQQEAIYRKIEQTANRLRRWVGKHREYLQKLRKDDFGQFKSIVSAASRLQQELRTNRLYSMFPDDDYLVYNPKFDEKLNLKRDNYRKHVAFINATKDNQFMAFFAGNRVGKTQVGAYMTACHLTGLYPPWWKGHRFQGPIQAWVAVENYESTKDPVQKMLFGRFFPGQQKTVTGDGMVPRSMIDMKSLTGRGSAANDVLASVNVKHINSSGRQNYSQLHFKSFQQSEQSYVGRAVDWIWIDEGPSYQIFKQCSMRIVSQGGRLILTWTPLNGYTPVVQEFIPKGTSLSKVFDSNKDVVKITKRSGLVMAGWRDIPHIPEKEKKEFIQHLRDTGQSQQMINARIKGIPHVGAGKVYRLPRSDLQYDHRQMGQFPSHWKHVCGLDPGWHFTAAVWGCIDPDTGIIYLYSEHYGEQKDVVHNAAAIKSRGEWIPVVMDPAGGQRQQGDGKSLMELYQDEGLNVSAAKNAVEGGIEKVKKMMYTGRLRVAKHLQKFWREYDLYSRKLDEEQDIAKILRRDNHLMDAMRYLVMSGRDLAISKSEQDTGGDRLDSFSTHGPGEL